MKEQNLTNRTVWSREVLKGSLEGLIIALLLFRILFNVVVVSGPSMVPTLADNSVILTITLSRIWSLRALLFAIRAVWMKISLSALLVAPVIPSTLISNRGWSIATESR